MKIERERERNKNDLLKIQGTNTKMTQLRREKEKPQRKKNRLNTL